MNKNMVIAAAGGLLVGLLAGYVIGVDRGMEAARLLAAGQPVPGMPAAAPGAMPPGMGQGMPPGMGQAPPPGMGQVGPSPAQLAEFNQRIDMNQRIVAQDPKNVAAWIALGNDYFDTRQLQKSVDAYAQALKLQPNNPDVLTDQGAMYEQLGDFDRALANFEQAQKIAPTHVQSAFNIGVIWANRKKDDKRAAAAWKRVIEIAPTSPQAAEARQSLAQLGVK